jgi:hypothetical protein
MVIDQPLALLRARSEWPRDCGTAEKSDELAPPHCLHRGSGQDIVSDWASTLSVRFGSLADICSAKGHVRFAPNSDRESGFPANGHVRFAPKSRHVRCS